MDKPIKTAKELLLDLVDDIEIIDEIYSDEKHPGEAGWKGIIDKARAAKAAVNNSLE